MNLINIRSTENPGHSAHFAGEGCRVSIPLTRGSTPATMRATLLHALEPTYSPHLPNRKECRAMARNDIITQKDIDAMFAGYAPAIPLMIVAHVEFAIA